MIVLYTLWIVLQIVIGYNLVFPFFLFLLHSVVVLFSRKKALNPAVTEADYAIIVTAYEQTDLLPSVVASLLKLRYSNYIIYIVADKCDISGLRFDDQRVVILRPPETLASNVRSHFYAINHFKRNHERLTIIDSDNLVDPDYLLELNKCFDLGFVAVQGLRAAKNLSTTYACLDAARDIYYHFYDGKLLFESGSSATLAGSGMAFTTALYKECLENNPVSGAGFDKVLQAAILKRNKRIAFTDHAIVYDEKTAQSQQLVKQRARWINTWFRFFSYGFTIIGKGLLRFSRNQILFGFVLLRPPLFIFLLLSVFFMMVNVLISPITALLWLVALILFVFSFMLSLWLSPTDKKIYSSLINIPKFIYFQVQSLMKAKKANAISVATKHVVPTEEEKG